MLNELKIDNLLGKVDSRYGLVLAGARRARQINEYTATLGLNDSLGIPGPQVHTRSQHSLSIAFEELRTGKLQVGFKKSQEELAEEVEQQVGSAGGDAFGVNAGIPGTGPMAGEDAPEDGDDSPEDGGDTAALENGVDDPDGEGAA
ncbi:MAG: DNA-directed RNA polymerase subunit omega [Actinomycetota bacterium]|jgi:DNA-directed RNA polymerase subunit omega|nr:DNA-directed RNA polymerase subunit omega [Actinomycetota bacterium]